MSDLVFLLEGESEKEMLKVLLPAVLPKTINPVLVSFEGKQDLKKRLGIKIKGWISPCIGFVVLCDKDHSDCVVLKNEMKEACSLTGKKNYLIRIACSEIESWYLGDLLAVEQAIGPAGISTNQNKKKFRSPDNLSNAKEELRKITNGLYREKSGSREIGKKMSVNPHMNKSHSFGVFISGVQRIISQKTH